MTDTNSPIASIVRPDEAATVNAFGDTVVFHLTGLHTGGQYTVFTSITQPGGGPPPHVHDIEDEWFLVQEGRAEFFNGEVWTEVPVGTSVFMQRGTVHTFRNAGDTPLKLLVQASPSGFETFFTRCAAEFEKPGGPDMAEIMKVSAEHGIRFV